MKRDYYMNLHTGSVDTYDGWFYVNENGVEVNAVDLYEVVEVVNIDDTWHAYDAVVNLMDDEIRERLQSEMVPCTNQEFVDAYIKAHAAKYDGEEFTAN